MTGKEMEQAIEFLINHHSEVSADIRGMRESIGELRETVASIIGEMRESNREMRESNEEMREANREMRESIAEMRATLVGVIEEMHEGFNNLIIANEVTRNLAEQAAKLAISASQRVTKLEDRLQ